MAGTPDIHERIHDAITARQDILASGAPTSGGAAWSTEQIDQALQELAVDLAELKAHWRTATKMSTGYPLTDSAACGNPQPCPHVLALGAKYGVLNNG
jgi:hypothetical protein